jgi:hypothetical protein
MYDNTKKVTVLKKPTKVNLDKNSNKDSLFIKEAKAVKTNANNIHTNNILILMCKIFPPFNIITNLRLYYNILILFKSTISDIPE